MLPLALLFICALAVGSDARPAASAAADLMDISKLDLEHVDCNSKLDMIDECGLQQGFTYRFNELSPALNHSSLHASCKRQSEAFRCLKAHSKCLPALSKQVLIALVNSRQKFNKKICAEKPTEAANKLIEFNMCMRDKGGVEKAMRAELNSIITPEAIINTKFDSVNERLKQSCCSVAKARVEYSESARPHCAHLAEIPREMIDSYLSDTVGIICPDFETKLKHECDKLPKLNLAKTNEAKSFIKPIIAVVQTLAP